MFYETPEKPLTTNSCRANRKISPFFLAKNFLPTFLRGSVARPSAGSDDAP